MKIAAFDISDNSSQQRIKSAIRSHMNADIVYAFDQNLYHYHSAGDLLDDINNKPDCFFNSPCSFYDSVISICSRARKEKVRSSISVISSGEDDCSYYSDEDSFNNYIHHLQKYYPIEISIIQPASLISASSIHRSAGFLKRLTAWGIVKTDTYDYGDYYEGT